MKHGQSIAAPPSKPTGRAESEGADQAPAFGSLTEIVARAAERAPDQRIFTFLHPHRAAQTVTAGQLHDDAGRIAAVLHTQGVRSGEVLPLALDHGYELIAAFWGAMYLGAVPTILPYVSRETRTQFYLEQVGRLARFTNATTVVTMPELHGLLEHSLVSSACRVLALTPWPVQPADERPATWCASGPDRK